MYMFKGRAGILNIILVLGYVWLFGGGGVPQTILFGDGTGYTVHSGA